MAGLSPLILEKSRQAQFLKPMAISISYGIMIATFLTLLMLPLLLSINNSLTVRIKWLITGKMASKEEVTRAVKELKLEENDKKSGFKFIGIAVRHFNECPGLTGKTGCG